MKKTFLLILSLIVAILTSASVKEPVKWTTSIKMNNDKEGVILFHADIESGWHLYGMSLPDGGPRPTVISIDKIDGASLVGSFTPSIAATEGVDETFNLKLSWWSAPVTISQKFELTGDKKGCAFSGLISFQACNNQTCITPVRQQFEVSNGETPAAGGEVATGDSVVALNGSVAPESSVISTDGMGGLWAPADFSQLGGDNTNSVAESSWWYIFIWGFLGGLVALLTPCVWPMIPMTVSFFLKKSGNKGKGIGDALLYGFAIVVIYLVLGLAITLIFGASKLNELSTNAIFNLAFFALLVVFAISFFGAFEIKLPARWSNATDGRAERTSGIISIFFMAFTLALVSFSCTGPIIGTLLVEAASTADIAGPAIGMGAFALALAIPFALFAMFPSWLKSMPRSGGWLNSVKVVLGFLELALSLKFLSVADLAYGWGLLDREVFICLWVAIFLFLTMYLLGKISFSHDTPLQQVSISRFFLALASLSFAIYLVPGLWGAPLKGVSAFVPPLYTQDFNLYEGSSFKEFHDYDEGMAYAAREGKPVLLDFSGYGCVNCRKMEGAVFDTEQVREVVGNDYVLIVLMVDERTKLEHPITVKENGKDVVLETVGDKWSYLQRTKFNANSQPYYVQLDNEGRPVSTPYYYDEDVTKFLEWLSKGLEVYESKK